MTKKSSFGVDKQSDFKDLKTITKQNRQPGVCVGGGVEDAKLSANCQLFQKGKSH